MELPHALKLARAPNSRFNTPPTILPQDAQSTLRTSGRRRLLDGQVGIDEFAARVRRRGRRAPPC
jgi:hypothetical protein